MTGWNRPARGKVNDFRAILIERRG